MGAEVKDRVILDLYAGSGESSRPYREAGYDVRRVELADGEDVRLLMPTGNVWGILAGPPCTDLAGSGARWWAQKGPEALLGALALVDAALRAVVVNRPEWWSLENPVGRLRRFLGTPQLIFDPCDYGDPWTKKTLLWGEFRIPEKVPVAPTQGSKMHRMSSSWAAQRAVTPPGFARAFFEANP